MTDGLETRCLRRAASGRWTSRLLLATVAMALAWPQAALAEALTVASFNIRYGTAKDGDNAWPKRRDLVFETIRAMDADVLGLQEALAFQREEIERAFPGYAAIGRGRNKGGGGEQCTILVRRDRVEVVASGTFWLSDTPESPASTHWGNRITRICTWATLRDLKTGKAFTVLNTHFDHESQSSRLKSGTLLAARLPALCGDRPSVVMGDLNADEDNPAVEALRGAGLRDTYRVKHPEVVDAGTFNGFEGRADGRKIDYVLVSKEWDVSSADIVRVHEDGRYPSDHFPVVATVRVADGAEGAPARGAVPAGAAPAACDSD